jgi:hypothetical protein
MNTINTPNVPTTGFNPKKLLDEARQRLKTRNNDTLKQLTNFVVPKNQTPSNPATNLLTPSRIREHAAQGNSVFNQFNITEEIPESQVIPQEKPEPTVVNNTPKPPPQPSTQSAYESIADIERRLTAEYQNYLR